MDLVFSVSYTHLDVYKRQSLDRLKIRGVVTFFFLTGVTAINIKEKVGSTLGDSSPSNTVLIAEFKMGQTRTTEDHVLEKKEKIHKSFW